MDKGIYRRPKWHKDKGLKLIRVGGLSHVTQDNGKAPVRKGLWAFVWPHFDWWFVSGSFSHKNGRPNDPNQWRLREFWYKGPIYVRFDINEIIGPGSGMYCESRMGYPWWLTTARSLYNSIPKLYSADLRELKKATLGPWRVVPKGYQRNPYYGCACTCGTDHFEVFIPRRKGKSC